MVKEAIRILKCLTNTTGVTQSGYKFTALWTTIGGHLGITRTEEQVSQRFYWPGIRKTVTKHIQWCQVCNQKNSPINKNTAPLCHISVSQPFSFWAMDYMGPLSATSAMWCDQAFDTTNQNASTVAPLLVSRIFARLAPPPPCSPAFRPRSQL